MSPRLFCCLKRKLRIFWGIGKNNYFFVSIIQLIFFCSHAKISEFFMCEQKILQLKDWSKESSEKDTNCWFKKKMFMKFQILKKALKRAKDLKNFFLLTRNYMGRNNFFIKKACSMLNFSNLCFLTLFINILFFCSERQHYNLFLVFTPSSDVMNWVLLFCCLCTCLFIWKKVGNLNLKFIKPA